MKKVLKICCGEWKNASHDKRELSVVRDLGAEVLVVAKGPVSGQEDEVDGFRVIRQSSRPLGGRVPAGLNRVTALFTWAAAVRKLNVDVITGHDLSGLLIGWMSNFGKRRPAALVYDSHEYELERAGKRSRLTRWCVGKLECYLMKRSAFSVIPSGIAADEVQQIHKLRDRPVVVRNIPPYWQLDPAASAEVRQRMLAELNLPPDTFLVLYHGKITPDRGIENLMRAVSGRKNTAAVILGNAEKQSYLDSLHALSAELGGHVLFHPAVPVEELRNYIGATDACTSLIQASCRSYYLSLPNKFFEVIQALTPVIASDFPEMGPIVRQYGIGILTDPEDLDGIAAAIEKLRTDGDFYTACKENLKRAKEELCWEKEKTALQSVYRTLLNSL